MYDIIISTVLFTSPHHPSHPLKAATVLDPSVALQLRVIDSKGGVEVDLGFWHYPLSKLLTLARMREPTQVYKVFAFAKLYVVFSSHGAWHVLGLKAPSPWASSSPVWPRTWRWPRGWRWRWHRRWRREKIKLFSSCKSSKSTYKMLTWSQSIAAAQVLD